MTLSLKNAHIGNLIKHSPSSSVLPMPSCFCHLFWVYLAEPLTGTSTTALITTLPTSDTGLTRMVPTQSIGLVPHRITTSTYLNDKEDERVLGVIVTRVNTIQNPSLMRRSQCRRVRSRRRGMGRSEACHSLDFRDV
jgi:hypothetical protein